MSHIDSIRRPSAASAIVLALLLACLGLAACGGSSKSSSTSANAAATGSTATTTAGSSGKPAAAPKASRFTAALRECLQKNGITLPKSAPGQHGPGGVGGLLGGGAAGPQLPKGVTRAQYAAAVRKCGETAFAGRAGQRLSSPLFKAALTKFATCMRENGVGMPAPNTSGTGPIFGTKGIDTASARFKAAETKCSSALRHSFQGRAGGAPGGTGANGAPGGKGANGAPGSAAQGSAG